MNRIVEAAWAGGRTLVGVALFVFMPWVLPVTPFVVGLFLLLSSASRAWCLRRHAWRVVPSRLEAWDRGRDKHVKVAVADETGRFVRTLRLPVAQLPVGEGRQVWLVGNPRRRCAVAVPGQERLVWRRWPRMRALERH